MPFKPTIAMVSDNSLEQNQAFFGYITKSINDNLVFKASRVSVLDANGEHDYFVDNFEAKIIGRFDKDDELHPVLSTGDVVIPTFASPLA